MSHEPKHEGASRGRRQVRLELRPLEKPLSADELRWREQELERLIIKAACHRAARLAGQSAPGVEAVDRGEPSVYA